MVASTVSTTGHVTATHSGMKDLPFSPATQAGSTGTTTQSSHTNGHIGKCSELNEDTSTQLQKGHTHALTNEQRSGYKNGYTNGYTNGRLATLMLEEQLIPTAEMRSSSAPNPGSTYKVYTGRWFMLAIVCLLNLSNAMMWLTFAAAADTTVIYYGIDSLKLNMLVIVYLIVTVPIGFAATWIIDTFGLRTSLILSAWLNGIGGLLRNVSTFDGIADDARYPVLLFGQIVTACAQPLVMFVPTKLAALWFADNRRATANMIGSMMNPLGNLMAFAIIPFIVEEPEDIPTALWVVTGPALVILVLATIGVRRSAPPTPPSSSAAETSEPFLEGLKQLSTNWHYWVLNISFGAGLALYTALASFLEQILCPRGYSDEFAGICGALMIGSGIIFSGIAGVYVDKTKRFEEVVKISFSLAVLAGIAFTQVSRLRDMHAAVAITAALFGGFGLAIYPISMELAVELTYPVAEATSSGLCIVSGQLQGIAYMFGMQFLAKPLSAYEESQGTGCHKGEKNSTAIFTPQDWTDPNLYIFNCVSTAVVVFLLLFLKSTYRRLAAELKSSALPKTQQDPDVATISTTKF